jgi:hypothetical protein
LTLTNQDGTRTTGRPIRAADLRAGADIGSRGGQCGCIERHRSSGPPSSRSVCSAAAVLGRRRRAESRARRRHGSRGLRRVERTRAPAHRTARDPGRCMGRGPLAGLVGRRDAHHPRGLRRRAELHADGRARPGPLARGRGAVGASRAVPRGRTVDVRGRRRTRAPLDRADEGGRSSARGAVAG